MGPMRYEFIHLSLFTHVMFRGLCNACAMILENCHLCRAIIDQRTEINSENLDEVITVSGGSISKRFSVTNNTVPVQTPTVGQPV